MAKNGSSADGRTRLAAILQAVLVVVMAFLAGYLLASLGDTALGALGYDAETDFVVVYSVSVALQFVGFLAVVAWYFATLVDYRELLHTSRPSPSTLLWIVGGLAVLVGTNLGFSAVFDLLDIEVAPSQVVLEGHEEPTLFLLLVPITILLVAPAEELVFRGIVQGQLRYAYGVVPGVVVASILFAVVHAPALGTDGNVVATLLVVFTLGAVLGAIYELAGDILVPTAVHAGWNLLVFGWNYALATGVL